MPKKKKGGKKKVGSKKPTITVDTKLPAIAAVTPKNGSLLHSVNTGDLKSLTRLVEHYDHNEALNTVDVNGSTCIHAAVGRNDLRTLMTLVSYNSIDINAREFRVVGGYAAIHHACIKGRLALGVLDYLLQSGADANIKADSTMGETPLHICCKYGHMDNAKMLMNYGASGQVLDNFGNNPLFWAKNNGFSTMFENIGLPPLKTATAEEMLAIMRARIPKFNLFAVKKDTKGKVKGKSKK